MKIASRMLTLRNGNSDVQIPIRIFAPKKAAHGASSCRYEIDWPDKRGALGVGGFDSVQAIVLALQSIGAEIYSSSFHQSGHLFWDAPGKGYGFPVTGNVRDLLVGDDTKYF